MKGIVTDVTLGAQIKIEELRKAELVLFRSVQLEAFHEEFNNEGQVKGEHPPLTQQLGSYIQ